jgi:hypothetical protein
METAFERGWSMLKNGDLLAVAEQEGFEVFITTDKYFRDQQSRGRRRIAIIALSTNSWPRIQRSLEAVKHAVDTALPGSIKEVDIH